MEWLCVILLLIITTISWIWAINDDNDIPYKVFIAYIISIIFVPLAFYILFNLYGN